MAGHDGYTRYTVRIPTPLYERVKEAAGEKSVNAEIVAVLEEKYPSPMTGIEQEFLSFLMSLDHREASGLLVAVKKAKLIDSKEERVAYIERYVKENGIIGPRPDKAHSKAEPKRKSAGSIGQAIRQIRDSKGISEATLSRKTLLSRMYVRDIEAGSTTPNNEQLESIAKALGVEVSTIAELASPI